MTDESPVPRRRPVGVWVISLFYLFSSGFGLYSIALVNSGAIKVPDAAAAYFASMSSVDWLLTSAISLSGLTGALCLFLLKRVAVTLFVAALALNIALTINHMMRLNWIAAIGGTAGLVNALVGWLLLLAVILYARKLSKRGVLN